MSQHKFDLWWSIPKGDERLHGLVFATVKQIDNASSGLQSLNLRNLKLYGNQEVNSSGLNVASYVQTNHSTAVPSSTNKISLNVIASCVDTLVAKIGKNKVKPYFLSSNATLRQKRKAQSMNRFTQGLFHDSKVYKTAPRVLKDACIMGTGVTKVYTNPITNRVTVDRVLPDELCVDINDGYYGEPRNLYQRKFVPKTLLKSLYPELADRIQQAQVEMLDAHALSGTATDMVLVIEAWHLPSSPDAKDGRHLITVNTVVLVDETWEDECFPFAILHYKAPVLGYFGSGVAEELTGVQIEINRLLMFIRDSMKVISNPRVYLQRGSKIVKEHMTNQIGGIVQYDGQAPIIQAAQAVHPEIFQQLERLYEKAFQIVGVSQLSSQSQKPSGLDSKVALREFSDIETERFATLALAYQELHIDIATLAFKEIQRNAKAGKASYTVKAFDRKHGVEKLDWKDIYSEDDMFVMQPFPTSALPDTPSGKLQAIADMKAAMPDKFDSDTTMDLLDFPDLDSVTSRMLSPTKLAEKICDDMVLNQIYRTPDPTWNLAKCQQMALFYSAELQLQEELSDKDNQALILLMQFADECNALIRLSQQPPPTPMPPPEEGMPPM